MTMVTVVVPWASTPGREQAMRHVTSYFETEFPTWNVVLGLSPQPFSRAAAINSGAITANTDILVVNDADSLVLPFQLQQAVAWATEQPGLVIAYTRYRRLTRAATERLAVWRAAFDAETEWQNEHAPSLGVIAIRTNCFDEVGGFDERFVGWGPEDAAFQKACERHWPTRRVPGDLVHLWHGPRRANDSPIDTPEELVHTNWKLFQDEYAGE